MITAESAQKMFDVINGCKQLSLRAASNDTQLRVGQFVITGTQRYIEIGVQLDQVQNIDERGILDCTSGRRFNTKKKGSVIASTRPFNGKYVYLYPLQENYDRAIARIEEDRQKDLRMAHRNLKKVHSALINLVSKLDPEKDRALVSELIETIEKSKQGGSDDKQ
jgi:hypothetical protein